MNGRLLKNCRAVSKFLMKSDIWYLPSTYCVTKFAYTVVPSIVVKTVFCDILTVIFYMDLKCGYTDFCKQRKQIALNTETL